MLSFQIYAGKEHDDEDKQHFSFGMKNKRRKSSEEPESPSLQALAEQAGTTITSVEKSFREHGLSDFISTLTPGAQNAIYAASFAWGYENAARYVKSAMKLSEVKGAMDSEEKSKAVIESMQKQTSGLSEKDSTVSRAIWSFYNEDMKETQVQTARSETLTEKEKAHEEVHAPQSAAEAIALGLSQQSLAPALLYCSGAQQAVEQQQLQQAEAEKKGEMAALVSPQRISGQEHQADILAQAQVAEKAKAAKIEEERKAIEMKIKVDSVQSELAKNGVSSEVLVVAMQRREELLREISLAEHEMKKAIGLLEKAKSDDEEQLRKIITSALSPTLAYNLLHRKKAFFKRLTIRKQLESYLAFCGGSKKKILKMPLGRIIKLISLSKLFGGQ